MHRLTPARTLMIAAAALFATAARADDPGARREREHGALRQRLSTAWRGPITDALRTELRRHAALLARLDRVKAIAEAENDTASAEQATRLVARENARHERWWSEHAAGAGVE